MGAAQGGDAGAAHAAAPCAPLTAGSIGRPEAEPMLPTPQKGGRSSVPPGRAKARQGQGLGFF